MKNLKISNHTKEIVQKILDFQFGPNWDRETSPPTKEQIGNWFSSNLDSEIKSEFLIPLENYKKNYYEDILEFKEGKLATIILLDQYSRQLFRKDKRCNENDPEALEIVLGMLKNGEEKDYKTFEKMFLGLVLMHSENLQNQILCIDFYNKVLEDVVFDECKGMIKMCLKFANEHLQIIQKFGRFPHRNEYLERENTEEEKEFLKNPPNWAK